MNTENLPTLTELTDALLSYRFVIDGDWRPDTLTPEVNDDDGEEVISLNISDSDGNSIDNINIIGWVNDDRTTLVISGEDGETYNLQFEPGTPFNPFENNG